MQPKRTPRPAALLPALALASLTAGCASQPPPPPAAAPANAQEAAPEKSGPLYDQLAQLDTHLFDAFNRCEQPGQLERHAGFFAEGVEFYHDQGGVTWSRAEMMANTQKQVCGKFCRELVAGSLRVYPIKDFGAMAQGVHRFCQHGSGRCEGSADFMMIWRQEGAGAQWRITRVLSYGHRAL
ncbi:nuclear transport factor 2 family protein [Kinneretia asaccharophila]|nr:nuclear transport factor 2 family protein [Roseateles asaccharophilus]MDN3544193.1 nuclear transport factor 2 family protein [Roseateles asaccharophilus]